MCISRKPREGVTQGYCFYTSQLRCASRSRKPQDTLNALPFDETEPLDERNQEEMGRGTAQGAEMQPDGRIS